MLQAIRVANDAVAPQCLGFGAAAIGLAIVGVLEQNADDLYAESLFELFVADVVDQDWVDLNETLSHTDGAIHVSVFRHPVGAESREQGLFAEKPAFGNLGYSV